MKNDFEIENGVLIKYHGNASEVAIPEGVTSIGKGAFWGCESLTRIIIPEGVTSIGESAFCVCISLTRITIPESVTSIGKGAFWGCKSLTRIIIPEGVTSIGKETFCGCISLTRITIPESVTSIDMWAFRGCSNLTRITIPGSVTSIGYCLFLRCEKLKEIKVAKHNQFYADRDGVLYDKPLKKLICCPRAKTNISIPNSVTSIEDQAFEFCERLTRLTIPDGVTSIGGSAFYGCTNLVIRYQQYIFASISGIDAEKMLKVIKKDFSVRMPFDEKMFLIFQMYIQTPEDEEILAYIKKDFKKKFKILIDLNGSEVARHIIASGRFINKKNIDDLISYAIEKKAHEVQVMLMNYKAENFGFGDAESDILKKFEL